jgi:hypothetical protein
VDLISLKAYGDVDLDKTPCLFLGCGHIFTLETLDGQMDMASYYNLEGDDLRIPISVKGALLPLSDDKMKTCPNCRASLRTIARYGRVVRRTLLDESTKKFIVWSNRAYIPLAEKLQALQGNLRNTMEDATMYLWQP